MKKTLQSFLMVSGLGALAMMSACNQNHQGQDAQDSTATDSANMALSISPFNDAKEFPGAALSVRNVTTEDAGDSVKVTFNFNVQNYELTAMTDDMHAEHSANSKDGQHIHFIMDNKPYQALYKPTNTVSLAKGSEHVLLGFLSRSYHLSLKNEEASALVKFKIDADGKYMEEAAPTEPMLFYSRPKGEYKGEDTKNLLLDFFVKNATISPNDYKVKVSVADTSFTVDQWQPYLINGAGSGDLDVKIELLDKEGKEINGDYGSIERTVKLTP